MSPPCPHHIRENEGGKRFVTTACMMWNTLPISLSQSSSFRYFKKGYFKYLKKTVYCS